MISRFWLVALFLCLSGMVSAQTQRNVAGEPIPADRIVAVVNDDAITLQELRSRLNDTVSQLQKQGTQLPPREVLERQMLERMIVDKAQLQFARDTGMRIDDSQLDNALQRIAASNKMSLAKFRETLQKDGIPFTKFREQIRDEMTIARVREREVENKIVISEGEIDNYLTADAANGGAEDRFEVAHILLRAPESANPEQLQKLKKKAELVYDKLKGGEDFSQLAAAYSDAPDALRGGNLGPRPLSRLPGLYADAVVKMSPGEVAPILRSPSGFHIVKLLSKSGGKGLPAVQQTHARHILIKVNEVVSEADAKHKLEDLRERIKNGAKFEELAKLYSQDGTAAKGGDLGWIYPGDTVPDFERAMNQLALNTVSEPVRTPFGFHLIEVLERRVQDASNDRQRVAARLALRERKLDEAYQDWLRQLRDSAYVEIRLEER